MEMFLTVIGTMITIISFGYAIYANKRHYKLLDYNREQAWEIYRQSSIVLAGCQKMEKMNIENNEVVTLLAKVEANARELALNSIRMIKRFENKYDSGTIDKWATGGRLDGHESHVEAFKRYLDD